MNPSCEDVPRTSSSTKDDRRRGYYTLERLQGPYCDDSPWVGGEQPRRARCESPLRSPLLGPSTSEEESSRPSCVYGEGRYRLVFGNPCVASTAMAAAPRGEFRSPRIPAAHPPTPMRREGAYGNTTQHTTQCRSTNPPPLTPPTPHPPPTPPRHYTNHEDTTASQTQTAPLYSIHLTPPPPNTPSRPTPTAHKPRSTPRGRPKLQKYPVSADPHNTVTTSQARGLGHISETRATPPPLPTYDATSNSRHTTCQDLSPHHTHARPSASPTADTSTLPARYRPPRVTRPGQPALRRTGTSGPTHPATRTAHHPLRPRTRRLGDDLFLETFRIPLELAAPVGVAHCWA